MVPIGQCHCGSLRVTTTEEPDRVYLCHCKACQRSTSTVFRYGATHLKDRARRKAIAKYTRATPVPHAKLSSSRRPGLSAAC